jgi:cobalt-zinc-cadmium efflux system protein
MIKAHSHDQHDSHDHHHGHGHQHSHIPATTTLLFITILIALSFAVAEAFAGWFSNSLTLLSDAGHMFTDALSLILAAIAAWVAMKPPSEQHSYGLGRAEVLGAWISSIFMVVVAITIAVEAIARLRHPEAVKASTVIIIASLGIFVNLLMVWILSRGEKTLNIRAAILHVMGDLLGSVAAFISGLVIYFMHWTLIDPLLSLFICVLILISSIRLLRETILVLMEGVPLHINLAEVGQAMAQVEHVISIHDLHIWTLASGVIVLTAHVEIDDSTHWDPILSQLKSLLASKYRINHITLQPESLVTVVPLKPLRKNSSS